MQDNDPRVYFAAERTLLAWVRTGVAVIGLGFIVSRFGLFMRLVAAPQRNAESNVFAGAVGCGLVVCGAIFTALAARQFALFLRTLEPGERPRLAYGPWLSLVLASAIAALGLLLAIYLLAPPFE
jgi:putative membrane protein